MPLCKEINVSSGTIKISGIVGNALAAHMQCLWTASLLLHLLRTHKIDCRTQRRCGPVWSSGRRDTALAPGPSSLRQSTSDRTPCAAGLSGKTNRFKIQPHLCMLVIMNVREIMDTHSMRAIMWACIFFFPLWKGVFIFSGTETSTPFIHTLPDSASIILG